MNHPSRIAVLALFSVTASVALSFADDIDAQMKELQGQMDVLKAKKAAEAAAGTVTAQERKALLVRLASVYGAKITPKPRCAFCFDVERDGKSALLHVFPKDSDNDIAERMEKLAVENLGRPRVRSTGTDAGLGLALDKKAGTLTLPNGTLTFGGKAKTVVLTGLDAHRLLVVQEDYEGSTFGSSTIFDGLLQEKQN